MIASIPRLSNAGFTGGSCPITGISAPNMVKTFTDFHLSYCAQTANYGSDTTALVIENNIFFVLNGDHTEAMNAASEAQGLQGCIDYFIEQIGSANAKSEHRMATGLQTDQFGLMKHALRVMGQANIDRLVQAEQKASRLIASDS